MTDIYIGLRDELRKILRNRGGKDGLIKKQEVYEVLRGIGTSAEIGDGDGKPKRKSDIFVVGCCVMFEDAIRFSFVGYSEILVEDVLSVIDGIRIAE